ncbi:MAG: isoleucine--tRNA ligase [bacterium]
MPFKILDPQPNFVAIEHKVQKYWQDKDILKKYLERNKDSKERFSFLDGPITANNPMALHHAWGRSLKDLYQRFQNMKGKKQRFQNGFDNQGLWVEVEVEKKLGFKNKKDIESYGVAEFIEKCKEHTLHFAKKQTEQSKRLGYFMDWGNDYYTMSDQNNYAIWHFLKKCWADGNLYKGRDSVAWCPRCGTAISQHEILNEEYQELTHDSIYFELPVEGKDNERFLVWTTTPWTLPANVALAVHPELKYSLVEGETGINFWLASALAEKIFGKKARILKKLKGAELAGLRYTAPFDHLPLVKEAKKEKPDSFHTVVLSKDYVNDEEGTGIVHIAVGCGQEDFALGKEKDLPVIAIIGENADYLEGLSDLSGRNAKNDPKIILEHPALEDYIFEITPHTHRYPTCWRCKEELVWRVVDEWYISMDTLRYKMMEITKQIGWIPGYGKDLELDWLKNMHDWLISKKRYWGLSLPIWECECGHFEVMGSFEELKERAVEGWKEFEGHTPHRPFVDKVKIKCSQCGKQVSRIPDVGNPWLDAGIVAYSTLKYFEDKDYWKEWFPADLVLECFPGQFKNWFYALIAESAVLEDKPPFKTLLGHALVLNEKGAIMHKSSGNAIWWDDAAEDERMGADVARFMFARQNSTKNILFGYNTALDIRRRFFLMLWNSVNFFVTFANLEGWEKKPLGKPAHVLDRWIVSRLNSLILEVTRHLERYQNHKAAEALENYVVNDLSGWYIRRSRSRVGDDFFATSYQVLATLLTLLAPFTPHLTEWLYQVLGGELDSIHLEDWPQANEKLVDTKLEQEMQLIRDICEKGHSARREAVIKVRQPLSKLTVFGPPARLISDSVGGGSLPQLVKEELNVKKVVFKEGASLEVTLDTKITPELKLEGLAREFAREVQKSRKKAGCKLADLVVLEYPQEYELVVAKFGKQIAKDTLIREYIKSEKFSIIL